MNKTDFENPGAPLEKEYASLGWGPCERVDGRQGEEYKDVQPK